MNRRVVSPIAASLLALSVVSTPFASPCATAEDISATAPSSEQRRRRLEAEDLLTFSVGGALLVAYLRERRRRGVNTIDHLLRSNMVGIIHASADGRIIGANDAFLELVGFTRADLEAGELHWDRLTPPEYSDLDRRSIEELRDRGSFTPFEKEYLRKDGSRVPVILGPVITDKPHYSGLCFVVDRTEVVELEVARLRLESRFDDLRTQVQSQLERLPIAYLIYSPDLRITYWNSTAEKMFGYSKEEALGQDVLSLIVPPEVRGTVGEILGEIGCGTPGKELTNENICKDGCLIICQWVSAPLLDRDGKVESIVANAVDVTDRVHTEESLRASEERLRIFAESTSDVVWDWDMINGRILLNDGIRRLLGEPDLPLEQDASWWASRIAPDDVPRLAEAVQGAVKSNVRWSLEYGFQRKDGSIVHVQAQGRPLYDAQNRPVRMIGALTDITLRKEAEQLLTQREEQLRQAQKMEAMGRLAGGIAHDFNNLLTAINGYSDLLAKRLASQPALQRNIEEIRRACGRAAALTQQLLAFSRKQALSPQLLNLNDVIMDMSEMLRRLLGDNVALDLSLAPDLGSTLVDRGQLEQIIMNLAVNARDAMPEGGTITIGTRNHSTRESAAVPRGQLVVRPLTESEYVVLSVHDTGTGIDDAVKPHLFEPFFTTKDSVKGTGLGLSTVYGIIEQSGGSIGVDTTPGHGSSFVIYLPRTAGAAQLDEAKPREAPHRAGSETLMLLEDEELVRHFAAEVLREAGYTVIECGDVTEARSVAHEHRGAIKLLISDVVMPGLSGAEAVAEIRKEQPDLPVLFISGYPDDEMVRYGVATAGGGFIPKPFSATQLLEGVRTSLDKVTMSERPKT